MKTHLSSSLVVLGRVARRTAMSVAAAALTLSVLGAPQIAHATAHHHHHHLSAAATAEHARLHGTVRPAPRARADARRPRVAAARAAAPGGVHRVSARLDPRHPHYHHRRGRRSVIHNVAFTPARAYGQAFGLHESPVGGLALRSSVAYVIDQNTLEPLYDKNSRAVLPIASITKLMTAMVAIDSKRPMNEMIEVTDEDRDFDKGTGSRLSVGSVLSREDMLHIALMASENRAAAALSRYYPGGRPAFLAAMNAKARELGMTDTHFENSTGLTSQNVSSARDLVKMINAAYRYPMIRQFSTDRSYEVFTGKRTLHYNSTNALIRNPSWDIGLQKTGFINEAGECLVMQATIHSRPVIIVLLDSTGKYSRFADATRLRAWLDTGGVQRVTSADTSSPGT